MLSRVNDFKLFTKIYAFSRGFKTPVAAQPNFYKYQSVTVAHDQVDLTTFTAIVFVRGLQAFAAQKFFCTGFGDEAFRSGCCSWAMTKNHIIAQDRSC